MGVKHCFKTGLVPLSLLLVACGATEQPKQIIGLDKLDPTGRPSAYWQLVWNDEFNASVIDKRKWNIEQHCGAGEDAEQQCYTKRKANLQLIDGRLILFAKSGSFTGTSQPDGDKRITKTLPYTSAKLHSKGKGDWRYGRIEVRARLPQGQGIFPAISMLPSDAKYGKWPASGEINIVEAVNLKATSDAEGAKPKQAETRVYGHLQYGRALPENLRSGTAYELPRSLNPADGFHTYAIEWEEGEIRWYVDNVHYATQRQNQWYSQYRDNGGLVNAEGAAPFDHAFHLVLDLAVGGPWAENANDTGVDNKVFPQALAIDYVRVYQCTVERASGKGCATVSKDAKLVDGYTAPAITVADGQFALGPRFVLFDGGLDEYLNANSYDPKNRMRHQLVKDELRGQVMQISKTGKTGNVFLTAPATNMSHWQESGELVFDLKLLSKQKGAKLLVKMDSGWPNTSDIEVSLPNLNEWSEVRIKVADLVANGNSFVSGKYVDLTQVVNLLVIEPSNKMTLQLDKLRFEYPAANMPVKFNQRGTAYYFSDFGGNSTRLTSDPAGQRGRVALTIKSEIAASWAGTSLGDKGGFDKPITLGPKKPIVSVWVYSPEKASPIRLKMTDTTKPDSFAEVEVMTKSAEQWEQLLFDFSKAQPSWNSKSSYNKLTLFFNFGERGAEAGEQHYYWDQLEVAK
ncbi:glycoside hydrolase family 16 protein [Agarivorans sp. 1_MG-2023]|uniref:glycoside hydrolase family 16 protein n=1 Tax=Agarivorans sp. 1_MG-2023 TaxID=3062634 RepID=UPI0026E25CE8|nr:glycoside hydrolase family 16 protein [Agarivorans sp. 1_MG-2023]MDO6762788.1 glycoside hydrolase family 16 protein [Agarivorans sp. 1_MG-2023]